MKPMPVGEAIEIIKRRAKRWRMKAKESANKNLFSAARTYKDMAYAADTLIIEIERELYK